MLASSCPDQRQLPQQSHVPQGDVRLTRRPRRSTYDCVLSTTTHATCSLDCGFGDSEDDSTPTTPLPARAPNQTPTLTDVEVRRVYAARDYLRRVGDAKEILSSGVPGGKLAQAVATYVGLLANASTDDIQSDNSAHYSHASPAGLWALLPLQQTTLPTPDELPDDIVRNPICTDTRSLVPVRTGGRDERDPKRRHDGKTVTVQVGVEPAASMYLARANKSIFSGSLRCDITLSLPTFTLSAITISAIVDTGASWTAIRLDVLKRFNVSVKFKSTSMKFTGITGTNMRCLGWTTLTMQFGGRPFETQAFVFNEMHEEMLVGVNTLSAQRMCIDFGNEAMYESKVSQLPDDAIPLYTHNAPASSADEPTFYTNATRQSMYVVDVNGAVCDELPCSAVSPSRQQRRQASRGGGRKIAEAVASLHSTDAAIQRWANTPAHTDDDEPSALLSCPYRTGPEERTNRLSLVEQMYDTGCETRSPRHLAVTTVLNKVVMKPGDTEAIHLYINDDIPGPNRTLEIEPSPEFRAVFPELGTAEKHLVFLHQSRDKMAQYRMQNTSKRTITILGGTVFGSAKRTQVYDTEAFHLQHHPEMVIAVLADDNYEAILTPNNEEEPSLPPEHVKEETHSNPNADASAGFEGIGSTVLDFEYREHEDYSTLPFDRGGKPRTPDDLDTLGVNRDDCVDASKPDCPGLDARQRKLVDDTCILGGAVWSRNAKVPMAARHPYAKCVIDTGDVRPIKQKPYPIPQKYLEAVRREIDGLLKAGLIEPGFGNWASPVLCILKKDSTPDSIKLKLAVDFRALNAVTHVDCALLGDQADILECFHGKPHLSLADAAGGFYQFMIPEDDRPKTGFILPSSCGGTLFQWRVAPYGLTNMPAIYSRAMQHVLRGLVDVDLGYATNEEGQIEDPDNDYLGYGSAPTWVDDITIATGGAADGRGIDGHCEMLLRIFRRLIIAGMTLKPSKTDLLRKELSVLGFTVTRDGLRPQTDKIQGIKDMPEVLTDARAVLRFLGMVNFYRRFIPNFGTVAAPLYNLLKGHTSASLKAQRHSFRSPRSRPSPTFNWTTECKAAYDELKNTLSDMCMTSHPDLRDAHAEFVLMTDASLVAAGAVLMQWQRPPAWAEQPASAPEEFSSDDDFDTTMRKRLANGYELRTLGFFSKTFSGAQNNWAIFDKEAGSIVLALNHWHRLVAGRPIAVYTDNTVAASILTNAKFPRPPRLQRWGVVLGSYLPLLRIAYKKGEENPVADHLSRYPTDYVYRPDGTCTPHPVTDVPDDLYDKVVSFNFNQKRYLLSEAKNTVAIEQIWAALTEEQQAEAAAPLSDAVLASVNAELSAFQKIWDDEDAMFTRESGVAESHLSHWTRYVQIFRSTYGRAPVVYDLFCGGGGFGRGAQRAGCIVVGVDSQPRPLGYGFKGLQRNLSNQFLRKPITDMHYVQAEIGDAFWERLMKDGHLPGHPPPDVVHASPPCAPHSSLRFLAARTNPRQSLLLETLARVRQYKMLLQHRYKRYVPFSVENVTGALTEFGNQKLPVAVLCGTMFGLRVFRHRIFITDEPLDVELRCSHRGKVLGNRGLNRTGLSSSDRHSIASPNMYAPYSWYSRSRGSMDELHLAMGLEPGAMSYRDLSQSLPPAYGEYVTAQLVTKALHRNLGVPTINHATAAQNPSFGEMLQTWAESGCVMNMPLHDQLHTKYPLRETEAARKLQSWFFSWDRPRCIRHRPSQPHALASLAARRIQRVARRCLDRQSVHTLHPASTDGDVYVTCPHGCVPLRVASLNLEVKLCNWPPCVTRAKAWHSRNAAESCCSLHREPVNKTHSGGLFAIDAAAAPDDDGPDFPEFQNSSDEDEGLGDEGDKPEEDLPRRRSRPPKRQPHTPIRPLEPQDDATPDGWVGPWTITLERQLEDAQLRLVYESLTTQPSTVKWKQPRRRLARRHRLRYALFDGRIVADTVDGPRVVVPFHLRYPLTTVSHRSLDTGGHRGTQALYQHLTQRYYWEGMLSDCESVIERCEVCRVRDLTNKKHPRFASLPDPPYPYHTVYIDYKIMPKPLKGSTRKYRAILVVVDGLTRYVTAVPVVDTTAESTVQALVKHVFSLYSMPSVVRSDNGPEFQGLTEEFAKYAGYRHIHVLPYNAAANGRAENAVKRVSELLYKHCLLMDNWADTLPMVCFALNCTVMTSTQMTPFESLYGRHPTMIPDLEDEQAIRPTYTGSDYVKNLVDNLRKSWDSVRDASSHIRAEIVKRAGKSRVRWAETPSDDCIAGIKVGDWVLLQHGSDDHARARRKHGYPAARRFQVTRLIPEANAVEIDRRSSTIQPVVSIRQCKKAPDNWWLFDDGSLANGRYEGPLTVKAARGNPYELGGRLPGDDDFVPDTQLDSCIWIVERILSARRSKRRWLYEIQWLGDPRITWESSDDLADAGVEVQQQMAEARERFAAKYRRRDVTHGSSELQSSSSSSDEDVPDPFQDAAGPSATFGNGEPSADTTDVLAVPPSTLPPAMSLHERRNLHQELRPVDQPLTERELRRRRRAGHRQRSLMSADGSATMDVLISLRGKARQLLHDTLLLFTPSLLSY